ncbi:MAG: MotA/TolQ/ExbB proton channel family protein [Myxococcales bacterium]|nr:MotA/TolQ/ExbB proton channel family protein [Myxococcales bacterium]
MEEGQGIVGALVRLPIFQAEWVLYLLFLLSVASVAVMVERWWFYRKHRVNADQVRERLDALLDQGDYRGAAEYLAQYDSFETNVVLFGLKEHHRGPDAVQDLMEGAESRERLRYSRRLGFLATVGSNAPFIGLFGTVLGIIRAFRDLSSDLANASGTVMAGISEALIATAVGLLVAIPAVIAYNVFTTRVKQVAGQGVLLNKTLLSQLKSAVAAGERS